jgi:hypothetical protein
VAPGYLHPLGGAVGSIPYVQGGITAPLLDAGRVAGELEALSLPCIEEGPTSKPRYLLGPTMLLIRSMTPSVSGDAGRTDAPSVRSPPNLGSVGAPYPG